MRHREARRRAVQMLEIVGQETAPIDTDVVARYLGFDVIPFAFPDDVAGVTYITRDVKSIGINKYHAQTRQRFSVAHEIGHYLLGHEAYDNDTVHVEQGRWLLNPHNQQEQEANEFAAELLMPRFLLDHEGIIGDVDVKSLAGKYRVSEQALWIQLLDHNFLS